jgi:hypothetical protein
LTRPSPQQGLRELRERQTPVCVCVCNQSATPLPLSHRSPAPHRRASLGFSARVHALELGQGLCLSPSLSPPPASGQRHAVSTPCVPSHFGRFTNVSERDRGRASMSPSAVSCAAPSAREPVRPVVIEPTAKALSATPARTHALAARHAHAGAPTSSLCLSKDEEERVSSQRARAPAPL